MGINGYDWYCESLHCWMLKTACTKRQLLATTGSYDRRATYASAGCGNCAQIKAETVKKEFNMVEMKKCKGKCGKTLPITDFSRSNNTSDGHEGKCRLCRSDERKANYRKRCEQNAPVSKSKGVPARRKVEEYVLPPISEPIDMGISAISQPSDVPVYKYPEPDDDDIRLVPGLPPGIKGGFDPEPQEAILNRNSMDTFVIDFAEHPDILQAVTDLAKTEFRPLGMQVLYMLKAQINRHANASSFAR